MNQVRFCIHCSQLIEHQWSYCPWCGTAVSSDMSLASVIENALDRIEKEQNAENLERLTKLIGHLDLLELELNAFLSGKK